MNEQTLADLMREIGLEPAYQAHFDNRPQRPRPRQMRDPAIRAADPQLAPSERQRAERQMYDAAQGPSRAEMTAPAYAAPRNQFAEAGQGALELTGLPSVRRSARAFTEGDLRTGVEEGAMGALGVFGMATLAPARGALNRAPVRPVGEPATRLPRHATQLPGRASDGSVLPVREPQPFRNSLRGGSDDLAEAASPGGAMREPIRPPGSEPGDVLARGGSGLPQRRGALTRTSEPNPEVNTVGARSATEAGTESDFLAALPTSPERWRDAMGLHPWIDRPHRAQIVVMASARDANTGRFLYSTEDILAATGITTDNSLKAQISQARRAGVPIPQRLRGPSGAASEPGGARLNGIIRLMEEGERNGVYMTHEAMARRLRLQRKDVDVVMSQARRMAAGHFPERLRERFLDLDDAQRIRRGRNYGLPKSSDPLASLLAPTVIAGWATQGALRPQAAQ